MAVPSQSEMRQRFLVNISGALFAFVALIICAAAGIMDSLGGGPWAFPLGLVLAALILLVGIRAMGRADYWYELADATEKPGVES